MAIYLYTGKGVEIAYFDKFYPLVGCSATSYAVRMENGVTYIGITNYRNTNQRFGIKDQDRLQHIYVLGKSGTGKSTLLKSMAMQDILRGNGVCILDPHGDVAREVLQQIPKERMNDLIYFNATDTDNPIAFNPLYNIPAKYHYLVASGLVAAFKKIWYESWGPRMEYILRYAILTLLEMPEATLLDIQRLLTNKEFRRKVLLFSSQEHILRFWDDEFDKYSPSLRAEAISPILNKVGLFTTSTPLQRIVGQKKSDLRFGQVMDTRKILVCNLSKGEIGEDASTLLGSMLVTSLQLAAMHRAQQSAHKRVPFYAYIDECHSFITLSVIDILAEARKYGLSLFLTHQYIEQVDEKVRAAIFGNVGTIISFRIGVDDAEYLAREFYPVFSMEDFVSLPRFSMYLKLMIDGAVSEGFSAVVL